MAHTPTELDFPSWIDFESGDAWLEWCPDEMVQILWGYLPFNGCDIA